MEILRYFSQVSKEQNDPIISQMKKECRQRPKDMTNDQDQRSHLEQKTPQVQNSSQNRKITITFGINHSTCEITDEETASLYEALNILDLVKREIERHPGKEMLVCGIEGIEGFINLGMPVRCFPDGSHVLITFSKTESEEKEDNEVCGRFDQSPAECVVFYIHAVGNRQQRILRCRKLHKEGTKLCVYGFKGETIKTTLRKDGRFNSFVESAHWRLINNDTTIANTQPVDVLQGKLFQIDVERKESPWVAMAAQKSELEDRNFSELKGYIVNLYPTLKREREKLRAYIKEESEKNKETSLFKAHRENFRKLTQNSTPGKVFKLLSQLSDSVGLIVWNNDGNRGSATCFLFKGLYIFTCRHIINDIVGEGIEPSKWPDIISECVRVTFDFQVFPGKEDSYCFVEPWFEVSDVTLDYAVLKLKKNGQHIPTGLCNRTPSGSLSGFIYMIGHPDGKYKIVDGCTVIPQDEQMRKCENIQGREAFCGSDSIPYIYMYTQRSFQKKIHEPGVVTWDNVFYCGSSGSPVFDAKGSLVGMHTAGFICEYTSGVSSIIELGSSIKHILDDIKQKHERWYNEICVFNSM
ncbi:protein FAM111A isoform X1 [Cricetulus griseus]|nr:protein FAM111A isoform X1 [Cricetulus griseus]XP_007652965.1 protein FAM111A isoform X1 [Cricetulus griseus]XP_016819142.1 protein FAM111A isoform X1 [Cricetulus griseus]XP_016819143.1 protein FAM111A isoform X1 [Cricetulus griseus]XP_027241523.1 protein FAM111A isoform X1 [Cricetulus griseus]XP_027241525.1 protein FAM111A isoform X1 [Cricetulus griseus]XP_027241527.1 protein FAM111A isoform X1 [Cricetulus griseus]XP_027241528.1 protein FAM111A isoform X1 [Cricetulus griseus]XP_02726241